MSTNPADLEDEVAEAEASKKVTGFDAKAIEKASTQMEDTSQEERDDLKDADVNGLSVGAQQSKPQIKIKRDDINYFVENFGIDKAAAEALLIEGGGDLYKTVLTYIEYDKMPEPPTFEELSKSTQFC
uniref:Nascent polypeptide-associated complex subunit alpha-like UBA domain-containing protein n=1 Tax=Panagrolaimus sp. ES5 TaxID=591445 RepID=A0AC34FT53_9BILA